MIARVSLTMIVKNEAPTLDRCLASVQDLVDEIIVVDTGSSDITKDIASLHGARIFDLPWPDSFAAARNESIRHARGQWLLWLDADEFLDEVNRAKLRQLLFNLPDDNGAYVMQQRSTHGNALAPLVSQVRLFRNQPDIRWDYRVHEQLLPSLNRAGHAIRITDIIIEHSGYRDSAVRQQKLQRNLRLLLLDLAERPSDAFTLFNLGWVYTDLDRCGDAVALVQKALRHAHPADAITPKVFALLTLCHVRLGRLAEAWDVCQAGNVRYPHNAELVFFKAQLCRQRGDRATARLCWRQLLDVRSTNGGMPLLQDCDGVFTSIDPQLRIPLVRHHLAVLDCEEGQFADAETHWRAALAQPSAFPPAQLGLAEVYTLQARWSELGPLLSAMEPHVPLDAAVLRARMHLARREFAAARRLLDSVITQAPQAVPPRLYLAHVLLQDGRDPAAAEQALRQLLALDPSQDEAWHNLASLLHGQGRLAEAIAVCQSALVCLPNHRDLLLLLGMLLPLTGDLEKAEAVLRQLLQQQTLSIPPANSESPSSQDAARQAIQWQSIARHHLALVYREQGKLAEAEAQWRAAVTAMPELHVAWVGLGELHLKEGRLAEVASILTRLERTPPGAEAAALLRVRWHWLRHEYAAARHQLEAIIAHQPSARAPRRLLTYVLLDEDRDRTAAERALRELLALDPNDAEARHNLAVVQQKQLRTAEILCQLVNENAAPDSIVLESE